MKTLDKALMALAVIGVSSMAVAATDTNWSAVWGPIVSMIEGLQDLFGALLLLVIYAAPVMLTLAVIGLVLGVAGMILYKIKKGF